MRAADAAQGDIGAAVVRAWPDSLLGGEEAGYAQRERGVHVDDDLVDTPVEDPEGQGPKYVAQSEGDAALEGGVSAIVFYGASRAVQPRLSQPSNIGPDQYHHSQLLRRRQTTGGCLRIKEENRSCMHGNPGWQSRQQSEGAFSRPHGRCPPSWK